MLTQALGLYLATPHQWRFVLVVSLAVSTVQLLLSSFVVESPAYLSRNGLRNETKAIEQRLWGNSDIVRTVDDVNSSAQEPLLEDPERQDEEHPHTATITVPQLLRARELRRPLMIVSFAMLSQQTSGSCVHLIQLSYLINLDRHQCRYVVEPLLHTQSLTLNCIQFFTTAMIFFPRPFLTLVLTYPLESLWSMFS